MNTIDEPGTAKLPLLPAHHPTANFFVCKLPDVALKGEMAAMEHPIFSLSSSTDDHTRRYEHNGIYVEVEPSAAGAATIFDRSILIYCISQLIGVLNADGEVSPIVRFCAHDLLKVTKRATGGAGYIGLKAALERLCGTTIRTNIVTGGIEQPSVFRLLDRVTILPQARDGRMQVVEVRLSDWIFRAVLGREVLTLHRDYFRLRKPLERRLYELARKHCGHREGWKIAVATLWKKSGSGATLREFKRMVKDIVRDDERSGHMPDYSVRLEANNMVIFHNRRDMPGRTAVALPGAPLLDAATYAGARAAAPGWDIRFLEQQWREWMTEPPRNAKAAFIGFCRKWFENHGRPQ